MCGIIGVLGNIPEKNKIIRARDKMEHRGPDDSGIFYDKDNKVTLGHRRLSIIDLSSAGKQPFFSNSGRYVISFNGEIYNYLQLKKDLTGSYDFKTNTDTEVILAMYEKYGENCLKYLQGMFAFAIWDRKEKRLFVTRDRLGIKPLYYTIVKNNFYFASEIKGILNFDVVPRKLNKQGFLDYLSYRYVLGKYTMFKNIYSLLPGHYILLKCGEEPKVKKYWDLPVIEKKQDPGEGIVLKKVEDLLLKTIESHMMGDVPVGAYLSGGLDSSLLVAMMARISKKPIKTFSIGFKEKGFNEFKYARKVAKSIKTDHHEIVLDDNNYFDILSEAIGYKDLPLSVPNEVPVHVLSKELKKHISIVLSGEGADELFGGYGRLFKSGYDIERIRLLNKDLFDGNRDELIKNLEKKYDSLESVSDLDHFLNQYTYHKFSEKKALINSDYFNLQSLDLKNKNYFKAINSKLSSFDPTNKFLYLMQKVHIVGLLHRLDSMTMSSSVEGRVPFVDHKLVEFVSSLPLKYKIRWKSKQDELKAKTLNSDQISEIHDISKYILRKISKKYLPKDIIERKKVGFPVPLNNWFKGDKNEMAKDLLLSKHTKSKNLYNRKNLENILNYNKPDSGKGINIWMLVNMEMWMDKYGISL